MNSIPLEINNYVLLQKIGNSSFTELYTVKEKTSGEVYAAKIALKTCDDSISFNTKITNEMTKMKQLGHASILQFIGYSPIDFHNENKPVIISQFMPNKSLHELLTKNITSNCWNDTKKLINIYGIASAMSFLHSHDIIHGYLYPTNILMDYHMFPKVTDFQPFNLHFSNQNTIDTQTSVYIAPELCGNSNHSKAGDVYAFGMVIYEILTNEKPFQNLNFLEILTKVASGNRPEITRAINDSYKNLIEKCWSQNPDDRPTFDIITKLLRMDQSFITDSIDKTEYENYINYIDEYQSVYEKSQKSISIEDFTSRKMKIFGTAPLDLNQNDISDHKTPNDHLEPQTQDDNKKDDQHDSLNQETKKNEPSILFEKENTNNQTNSVSLFEHPTENKQTKPTTSKTDELFSSLNQPKQEKNNKPAYLLEPPNQSKPAYLNEPVKPEQKDSIAVPQSPYQGFQIAPPYQNMPNDFPPSPYENMSKDSHTPTNEKIECNTSPNENIASDFPASPYQNSPAGFPESPYKNMSADIFESEGLKEESNQNENDISTMKITFNPLSPLDSLNKYSAYRVEPDVDKNLSTFLKLYDSGRNNRNEAMNFLKSSLQSGSTKAMNTFGALLYKGQDFLVNKEEAARHFKMSFENGDLDGMFNYACVLFNGEGVPENKEEAIHYIEVLAVEKKHLYAMNKYGSFLEKGIGLPQDRQRGLYYIKTAAESGCPDAMYNYAICLKNGHGIPVNEREAYRYGKMAADHGYIPAFMLCGAYLFRGVGVAVNKKGAMACMKVAADNGIPQAMMAYSSMLLGTLNLEKLIFSPDSIMPTFDESLRYLKMAADNGNVKAMSLYAKYLCEQKSNPLNARIAAYYYKMAADQGGDSEKLQYAAILNAGKLVPLDKKEASRYFKMSADRGNVIAMSDYATMLRLGDGIQPDKKEAAKYYRNAAMKGNIPAMNFYGLMSLNGEIECDKSEAVQFLTTAANTGFGKAIYNLGMAKYRGHGTEQNKEEAIELFKKAADKGVKEAADSLKSLGIKNESNCSIF
ncbi:hypothetical protein M9Y10_024956 [Tritrichomonas musculus]|uniref:Protein kinase domain-containing protein n=1 Tax=Tritrichomonas musculus TaxID=1915356 RepID=A0ABR2HBN7_9EUKA